MLIKDHVALYNLWYLLVWHEDREVEKSRVIFPLMAFWPFACSFRRISIVDHLPLIFLRNAVRPITTYS
jgi:hypothetical protein